jgi:hypothetical protein
MVKDVKPWDLLNPNEPRSQDDIIQSRLDICKTCEFYRERTNQCRKCGCFMKLKTRLEHARCPIGKW